MATGFLPTGFVSLMPLAHHVFESFCSKVFGRLLELVELWAGLRVKRQFS
jgi:hypothetical protein